MATEKSMRALEDGQLRSTETINGEGYDPEYWRHIGYPGLCNFISSSRNLFVHRSFNTLNSRVILHMQCEIVEWERRLEIVDNEYKGKDQNGRVDTMQQSEDPNGVRRNILLKLRHLLKEYNDFVLSYSQIRSKPQAEKTQIRNFSEWFNAYPHAIRQRHEGELFIREDGDVVALIPQAKSWLRLFFDEFSPNFLSKLFPQRKKTGLQKRLQEQYKGTFYWSDKAINVCITFLVVGFGLMVLIGPLWWLNNVEGINTKLGIITGFLVFFAFVLASATVDRPFEVLIGTAAYAAVLMVYIQQQPP